jgi:dihydrofolate synthase/folylpolyglutamate synthase
MEIFRYSPLLLFDGAHNTEGARALADNLQRYCPGKKMTVAMAVMQDKDVDGMLKELHGVARRFIALEVPGNPRALGAKALQARMRITGVESVLAQTMEQALACREDTVVCGSLYLYASFRQWLQNNACL